MIFWLNVGSVKILPSMCPILMLVKITFRVLDGTWDHLNSVNSATIHEKVISRQHHSVEIAGIYSHQFFFHKNLVKPTILLLNHITICFHELFHLIDSKFLVFPNCGQLGHKGKPFVGNASRENVC